MIETKEKIIKYPENLPLKQAIEDKGLKVKYLAKKFGVSNRVMSQTINGHYKGDNIVPKIKAELGIND
ncbi:MAG: hypothetical protein IE931_03520 [Sphingobacteriales bacterium]|nr:hypothetical protein [Sphingobacteriales bacterium]